MFKFKTIPATALIALGIASSVSAKNLPTSYEVIDLGALPVVETDPKQSSGFALNDSGDLVGTSRGEFSYTVEVNGVETIQRANVFNAVRFFEDNINPQNIIPESQKPIIEAALRGAFASSVSSDGVVVGYRSVAQTVKTYSQNSEGACVEGSQEVLLSKAFYDNGNFNEIQPFERDGEALDEMIVEYRQTRALDIANSQIVGEANVIIEKNECNGFSADSLRGMKFDILNESASFIEPLDETHNRTALTGINSSGTFVGHSGIFNNRDNFYIVAQAFISNDTQALTPITGLVEDSRDTLWDINESGIYAVGSSNSQAFYYDISTETAHAIGFLDDRFKFSQALSVNDHGLVVGISQQTSTPLSFSPFIYDIDYENEVPVDLNTLIDCDSGWNLSEAREINNQGWIIGSGTVSVEQIDGTLEGEIRAFLLKPRAAEANQSCETTEAVETGGSINGIGLLFLTIFVVYRRYPNYS
ncbi:DUF3466 family protein [Pleionea mediterranea]|uniref:Uncharacterized protein DUF3466 n=1 Tax=Pleionea mediterranea TaxID=523701 RepID=A0A316FLW3_9GAMM|nr:DUF3466 family protein [Pleionea mediterranea]PWK49263.1 uncharacterized protein DUF3466 [Pleionea mediterranea]